MDLEGGRRGASATGESTVALSAFRRSLRLLPRAISTQLARNSGLSTRAWQVGVFVLAVFVLCDATLTVAEGLAKTLVEGRSPLLDAWDTLKAVVVAIGVVTAGFGRRSAAIIVVGILFGFVGIEDQVTWHAGAGQAIAERWDLSIASDPIGLNGAALGEFIVLGLVAAVGVALVFGIREPRPRHRQIRRSLAATLALLVVFAVFVDLLTAVSENANTFGLVEELGERVALSLAMGLAAGLIVDRRDRAVLDYHRPTA